MNIGHQSWRSNNNTLSIQLYLPGVDQPRVQQKGRTLTVVGSNENYGVSYHYVVPLHPDSRDNVRSQYHNGLLILTTDNINNVDQLIGERVDCVVEQPR